MIYQIYAAATTLVSPILWTWLCFSRRHRGLLERFRPQAPSAARGDRPVWIHVCSVGEVNTAAPIVQAIHKRFEGLSVVVTTSTAAGRALAVERFGAENVSFLPWDIPANVRLFITRMDPAAMLLIETELWPAVIHECSRLGVPVAIVNGRLSDGHVGRYRMIRPLLREMFACIEVFAMQTETYAARAHELGAPSSHVHVTGNTKFDAAPARVDGAILDALRNEIALDAAEQLMVFGSTRPGDEALAGRTYRELRKTCPRLKVAIAPRHVERADEAVRQFGGPIERLSRIRAGAESPDGAVLVDTHGELANVYALATVAVIGGSFYPGVEGHNPIEPAALGVPAVFGPYMRNFADPAQVLVDAGAAAQCADADDLGTVLRELLDDPDRRRAMGERGIETVLANRGATTRTLDLIGPLLTRRATRTT